MVKPPSPLSALESALLALLRQAPLSGYDLRRVFADTPFVHFSDSPGAVYPALRRLEARGLVAAERRRPEGGRGRRGFVLTARGRRALESWLRLPVTVDELAQGRDVALLRFAFTEEVLGRAACVRFLEGYAAALETHVTSLEDYARRNLEGAPLSGRLAFECGVEGFRARLDWCRRAVTRFEQEKK
jgi:DNA-binding PadR family transcriptional regulator